VPEQIPPPQTIVVFGASGDLSRRKIFPALYNLARDGLLPEQYAVVGSPCGPSQRDVLSARIHAHRPPQPSSSSGST
jgi:glucose-6-phosphate 1-dehydrogenase